MSARVVIDLELRDRQIQTALNATNAGIAKLTTVANALAQAFDRADKAGAFDKTTAGIRQATRAYEALMRSQQTQEQRAAQAYRERKNLLYELYRAGKLTQPQMMDALSANRAQFEKESGRDAARAQHEQDLARRLAAEKVAAAKSLAEQKAAALSLAAQKARALNDNAQAEKAAAAKSLAEQKAAALSLDLQKRTSIAETSRLQREAAAALHQQQLAEADQVRRSMLSQRQLAKQNYVERMQHLVELRKAGVLTESEFSKAATAAKQTFRKELFDASPLKMFRSELVGLVGTYVSLQAAISMAVQWTQQYMQANREMQDQSARTTADIETLKKRFQVQGSVPADEMAKYSTQIEQAAADTAMPIDKALRFATASVSSGFDVKDSPEAAKIMMQIAQASGLPIETFNPEEMAKSLSIYLKATGAGVNTGSLRRLGDFLQSDLVKSTPLKINELQYAAMQAQGLTEFGIGFEEQSALMAVSATKGRLRMSETQAREVIRHLRHAAGSESRTEALAQMGLTPDQVDFHGESLVEVLNLLEEGRGRIKDPAQGSLLLEKLVEGANVGQLTSMIEFRKDIEGFSTKGFQQPGALERDAGIMATGRAAAATRSENQTKLELENRSDLGLLYRNAMKNMLEREGKTGGQIDYQLRWYDWFRGMGFSPESATRNSVPKTPGRPLSQWDYQREVEAEIERQAGDPEFLEKERERQRAAEQQRRDGPKKAPGQPDVVRVDIRTDQPVRVNTTPTAPRPSESLSQPPGRRGGDLGWA